MSKVKVLVSEHAKKRLSKRRGINRKGHQKHANEAFYKGEIVQPLENEKKMLITYQDNHYIYGLDPSGLPILVTYY